MFEVAQPLFEGIKATGLAIPRIMVCLLILPALSSRIVNGLLRSAISIGIAIPVAVSIFHSPNLADITLGSGVFLLIKEAVIGLLIGFFLALPFWMFQSMGTIFDTQRGALMGEQLNPETGTMTSITGQLMLQFVIVAMIELGAFIWMFGLITDSFVLWPATAWMPEFSATGSSVLTSHFSSMAVSYALYVCPLMLTLLAIELIFALIGLYSPQLQVYFIAMPVKSLVGLFVLVLLASTYWGYVQEELSVFIEAKYWLELLHVN